MRNYKKEYENYHSRPEQKIRRAARNAARKRFSNADPTLDVHHKDNDPLNNDLNNLSLVTQHYNRKEPRLREKKLKDLQSKLTKALRHTTEDAVSRAQEITKLRKKHTGEKEAEKAAIKRARGESVEEGIDADAMIDLMQKYLLTKNKSEKKNLLKQINRYQKKLGLAVTEAIEEGLTDPQELAKEIEWGASSKNVDSQALSTKQKKQMKDIVKLMKRSKAPNWVSKFTQVYFTSDKLVQQRLKSAAKRGGMSPELMKKLFKEDMGSVTGPHIAGTGDDNTVHTKPKKKKIQRRISLIKSMARK